jgi:hypothetical protein
VLQTASNPLMRAFRYILLATLAAATGLHAQRSGAQTQISSQASETHAKQLIEAAVRSELNAADHDHTVWVYREQNKTAGRDATYQVIDSPGGGLRRLIELNGRPSDAETNQKETDRLNAFVNDPAAQAKERKASSHDDAQARDLLQMLPEAFIWTLKSDAADLATLSFRPNPGFRAPNMEARVMGTMAGELIIAKTDNRIRTLRGALSEDVKIGYGMLGKLHQGGTFDIERREIAPHHWEITESRVHIDGRVLLFKTIGQQEDDIKSDWKPSTARTLADAAKQLGAN